MMHISHSTLHCYRLWIWCTGLRFTKCFQQFHQIMTMQNSKCTAAMEWTISQCTAMHPGLRCSAHSNTFEQCTLVWDSPSWNAFNTATILCSLSRWTKIQSSAQWCSVQRAILGLDNAMHYNALLHCILAWDAMYSVDREQYLISTMPPEPPFSPCLPPLLFFHIVKLKPPSTSQ